MNSIKKLVPISALSALKRRRSLPVIVVVAASGAGKSTLVYLIMNEKLSPHMAMGIGDKSFTTLVPCEFCFDVRIEEEKEYAIMIHRKDYEYKVIHEQIINVILELFVKKKHNVVSTLDAIDDSVINKILEPVGGRYHLMGIKEQLNIDALKTSLGEVFDALNKKDFETECENKKKELQSKIGDNELREIVFDLIFEKLGKEKASYMSWLEHIGEIIQKRLKAVVGEELFNGDMCEYNIDTVDGQQILKELFTPYSPFSLLIDHISLACKPRKEIIDMAKKNEKYSNLPFRFCMRDTMGINQLGEDAFNHEKIMESLEVALNCKADAVLYLMSLEEDDVTLAACGKALVEKQKLLSTENINAILDVYFTKADRLVENIITKRNTGNLYITIDTYKNNINDILTLVESNVKSYSKDIQSDDVSWGSLRFVKESLIVESLKENAERRKHFEPYGIFETIVNTSMESLIHTFPKGMENPIFVDVVDPDAPAICVKVDKEKIRDGISKMQKSLVTGNVLNEYIITTKKTIHGRSVNNYWERLQLGLGYSTRASVYGNFNINMKGLMKCMIYNSFISFEMFNSCHAVQFGIDNIREDVFEKVMQELFGCGDLETGMNPALGEKMIFEQRLNDYFVDFFNAPDKYAFIVDKVAYSLTFGNNEICSRLTDVFCNPAYGYDSTIRKLQYEFMNIFREEMFANTLVSEFENCISEMINKLFVVI